MSLFEYQPVRGDEPQQRLKLAGRRDDHVLHDFERGHEFGARLGWQQRFRWRSDDDEEPSRASDFAETAHMRRQHRVEVADYDLRWIFPPSTVTQYSFGFLPIQDFASSIHSEIRR
jgi:hypothetical protein